LSALSKKQLPLRNDEELIRLLEGADPSSLKYRSGLAGAKASQRQRQKQRTRHMDDDLEDEANGDEEDDNVDDMSTQLVNDLKKMLPSTLSQRSPTKRKLGTSKSMKKSNDARQNERGSCSSDNGGSSSLSLADEMSIGAPVSGPSAAEVILPAIAVPSNNQRPKLNLELSKALAEKINTELKLKRQQRSSSTSAV
jgi:hypothetical protein